ncbi:hypothetical protein [Aeromonas sp. LsrichE-8G]|uniref:hypothetical protein n=1 Tax=Aeromonas sp. LsrichE-8G TaxID=2932048 RepID=UPI001FD43D60|nr:hypothetical protein [Aeromonas sp. LsrichE-8G]MCJ7930800.1 hypothetical protein [Aeromonas sp. LsrichE-8G]
MRFTFGEPGSPLYASRGTYRFVSTYLVLDGPQGARITDIDAGAYSGEVEQPFRPT